MVSHRTIAAMGGRFKLRLSKEVVAPVLVMTTYLRENIFVDSLKDNKIHFTRLDKVAMLNEHL
jgi:hypothetical protein